MAGTPLICAVGTAVVRYILEHDVLGNVNRVGGRLKQGLQQLASDSVLVDSVRGEGLLLAVDLAEDRAADVVRLGFEDGLLLNATGPNTIRLAPPLILTEAEADEALSKLRKIVFRIEA